MNKSNAIHFKNLDEVNSGFQNTSGWFRKIQSSESPSNREVDKHLILRVKNVDDNNSISGAIRFNDRQAVFQGCLGNNNWQDFNVSSGADGQDGLNYRTVVKGQNLFTSGDTYYPLFKNIVETITDSPDDGGDGGDSSQITATVHRLPAKKYSTSNFDLSNHNVTYEPFDSTSYTVKVRENSSWPPVDYSNHQKYSLLNNGSKLTSDSYFLHNLSRSFRFYNTEYSTIYVNENGYITFGTGESAFVQNLLQNHFSKNRISAFFTDLAPALQIDTNDLLSGLSDIFVGTGSYGETVITYHNYVNNPGVQNFRTDFQVRLFLNEPPTDSNNLYSDDYFTRGSINIAYNSVNPAQITGQSFVAPLLGLSDASSYDAANFTELNFSDLKTDSDWVENSGSGIPFLRTFLVLGINSSETTSIANLKSLHSSVDNSTNKNETGSLYTYRLILDDLNSDGTIDSDVYETSYVENNYYTKIFNLGDVKLEKMAVAIRSIYDYETKQNLSTVHYSDSANYIIDKTGTNPFIINTSLEDSWQTIADGKFIDVSGIYESSFSYQKDFHNLYNNLSSNTNYQDNLYNSKIYRIQAKYQNKLNSNSVMEKVLLIKIIYTLNSDTDSVANNSIASATQLIYNRVSGGNNYGPFQYQANSIDVFSIQRTGLTLEANFTVQIYDYLMSPTDQQISDNPEDESLRAVEIARRADINDGVLTLELLDSTGEVVDSNNTALSGKVNFQNIKLFNKIEKTSPGSQQYYIKITGTNKLGYYGVSIIEPETTASDSQVSGVYSSYKLTKINASDFPLTTAGESLDDNTRVYSATSSDNVLLLMSNTGGSKMQFFNYTFSGVIKSGYPIETLYDNDTDIIDLLFLGEKFVAVTNPTDGIKCDIYNGSSGLERSIVLDEDPIPAYVFVKSITVNGSNYIILVFLQISTNLLFLACASESGDFIQTTGLSGITDTQIVNEIVDVLVFDEDNIFVVGNTSSGASKIYKFSLTISDDASTNQKFTSLTNVTITNGESANKTVSTYKYDYEGAQSIIVFYEEGSSGSTGFSISSFSLDFSEQNNIAFLLDSTRVPVSTSVIMNFKVKRDIIMIVWEDSNDDRYLQAYKIQLTNEEVPFLKIKAVAYNAPSGGISPLKDVDAHKVIINAQTEDVFVIFSENTNADAYSAGHFSSVRNMKVNIQRSGLESGNEDNIVEINSGITYANLLSMTNFGGRSIFNQESEREFTSTKEFRKLFKTPLPIESTRNDEQIFYLGFDASTSPGKLVLEGFGQLSDVENDTGETVSSNNIFKTLKGALTFSDIGNNNQDTTTIAYDNISDENPEIDLFDINTKDNYIFTTSASQLDSLKKFFCSMKTIKKTINSVDNYYTAVLYGPISITTNSGGYSSTGYALKNDFTFQIDIYKNDSYQINSSSSYRVTSKQVNITSYNTTQINKLLEIIPITDGFIVFAADRELSTTYLNMSFKKITVNDSEEWTITTTQFPSSFNAWLNTESTISPSFDWEIIDDGNVLVLGYRRSDYYSNIGPDGVQFFFINISSLEFSTTVSADSSLMLNTFINNVQNNNPSSSYPEYVDNANELTGSNIPPYLRGLFDLKNIEVNDKKYLYIFDYSYWDTDLGAGMHIIRCERDGDSSSLPADNYFKNGKVKHKYLQKASGVYDYEELFTNIFLINFFDKNLYYIEDTSPKKIHIYFWASFPLEFVYDESAQEYLINSTGSAGESTLEALGEDTSSNFNEKFTTFSLVKRIMRITIETNTNFIDETYTLHNGFSFTDTTVTTSNLTTQGPLQYPEILDGENLAQFDIVMDNDTRYIISADHSILHLVGSPSMVVNSPKRDILNFVIYEIQTGGALQLKCYGKNQSILGVHIENGNLVIFAPANSSAEFEAGAQYLKAFKKPLGDISAGTNIIMGTTTFTTVEPSSDADNTTNYPHFFSHIDSASKFIYNGATSSQYALANQTTGQKYNFVMGYSPESGSTGYGDNKSMAVLTFGDFGTTTTSDDTTDSGGSTDETTTSTDTTNVNTISRKIQYFMTQNGTSTDSNFVIGRPRNTSFDSNEDDIGTKYFSFINSLSLNIDTANFYIRTNSIPNYEPRYAGEIIKGTWSDELGDTDLYDYSIAPQNYGWLSSTSQENGTYLKIPHTITNVNAKSILVGESTITETLWFNGDDSWDAIMVNPGYFDSTAVQNNDANGYYITNNNLVSNSVNDKLLTPVGRIGVATNGTLIYNYSNLTQDKNAVEELKSDNLGGSGDSLHSYHFNKWPVNLEGMLNLGHGSTSIQIREPPSVTDSYTIKFIKGRTYYFNQIQVSNFDASDRYNLKFEPIYKGTTYRYKVKQVSNEYYLAPLDFAGSPIGGSYTWTRRMVLAKIKQGDTIIFHQDETFSGDDGSNTKPIGITSQESTPSGSSTWTQAYTVNTNADNIGTNTLSILGTVGQSGAKTVFNVPSSFDVGFLRYQPYNDTATSGKDKGSFIITGTYYNYTVEVEGTSATTPYFSLTPEGTSTQIGDGNSSPGLTKIKFGDVIFFNQTGNSSTYQLTIKTDNVDSSTNIDSVNFKTFIGDLSSSTTYSGLFFAPKVEFDATVFYNVGSDVTSKTVTGGSIASTDYVRPEAYDFEDTLVKHGIPGNSYCPYTKLTIPTFDDVKTNYLTMKYNSTNQKYEIYGTLNSNYYSNSTTNLLPRVKMFIDTKYVIYLDSTITGDGDIDNPLFSTVSSSYTQYSFEYNGADTFSSSVSGQISFRVGENITNLYLYNGDNTSNTTIGSTYNGYITGERNHNQLDKLRVTSLTTNVANNPGGSLTDLETFENYIKVTISDNKFVFDGNLNTDYTYYDNEGTLTGLSSLKLINGTKYKFEYDGFTGKQLKFSTSATEFSENNVTFDDTYDHCETNIVTFTVKGIENQTTLYIYDGLDDENTTIGSNYNNSDKIKTENVEPINIFMNIVGTNYRFYKTPSSLSFFKGYLDYENADSYLTYKLTQTGVNGHSPLLGFAFDGHPIYGPLGYDTSDSSYNSAATTTAEQSLFAVKLMKSSYTGGNDSEGNPTYVQGSGDLDICNGVFSKTPEFPQGIFHYVCTIELGTDGLQRLSEDTNYGYLNTVSSIVKPAYPYIIGAFKAKPEQSNFNTTSTTTSSTSSTADQITTYTINFKSLKTVNNKFNGSDVDSIQISQDDNYLNLRPNPHPYVWNFTNNLGEDAFFGKDNKQYTYRIDELRSLSTDTKFKAYGNVSKFIAKDHITKGMGVCLINNTRVYGGSNVQTLEVELYKSNQSVSESESNAAFLGIALNDATDAGEVYICTQGITTIKIGNNVSNLRCGSYGMLFLADEPGYVIGLGSGESISSNVPVAGYFVEDKTSVVKDDLVLFYVKGNFEFN